MQQEMCQLVGKRKALAVLGLVTIDSDVKVSILLADFTRCSTRQNAQQYLNAQSLRYRSKLNWVLRKAFVNTLPHPNHKTMAATAARPPMITLKIAALIFPSVVHYRAS